MIRIRYSSELQPGLNGRAGCFGRTTVVYLLPGLTPAQRSATLRRLRQYGRMGLSPRLPAAQLLAALLADRIRTAFGQAGAIVRIHPAGSTLPVMVVSAAVAGFLLLSAVSIRIIHPTLTEGRGAYGSGLVPPANGGNAGSRAIPDGAQPGARPGSSPGRAPGSGPATSTPGAGSTPGTGSAPGPTSSEGTVLTSAAATPPPPDPASSPAPSPAGSVSSSAPASPSAAVTPATSAGSSTKVCVDLGPFGVCLGL